MSITVGIKRSRYFTDGTIKKVGRENLPTPEEWKDMSPEKKLIIHRKIEQLKNKEYYRRKVVEYREKHPEYQRDRMRKWRIENPEKVKKSYRKGNLSKFGLTIEDYEKMFLEQEGRCKICGVHEDELLPKSKLGVDHCHVTNKVRALLCTNCNAGLGQFKDNIEKLEKAVNYLKSYQI